MTEATIGNIGDIPDLGSFSEGDSTGAFQDGWYEATIQEKREFTDKNGSDRVFESADQPSQGGDSRNIRLQVEIKRASDGRALNTNMTINYRPEDLSAETVQAIAAHKETGEKWGSLFRPFKVLQNLGKLQKIAGKQLQRNGNGGLDLHGLYGRKFYAKLGPDDRNPQYKAVVDFRDSKPTKAQVL